MQERLKKINNALHNESLADKGSPRQSKQTVTSAKEKSHRNAAGRFKTSNKLKASKLSKKSANYSFQKRQRNPCSTFFRQSLFRTKRKGKFKTTDETMFEVLSKLKDMQRQYRENTDRQVNTANENKDKIKDQDFDNDGSSSDSATLQNDNSAEEDDSCKINYEFPKSIEKTESNFAFKTQLEIIKEEQTTMNSSCTEINDLSSINSEASLPNDSRNVKNDSEVKEETAGRSLEDCDSVFYSLTEQTSASADDNLIDEGAATATRELNETLGACENFLSANFSEENLPGPSSVSTDQAYETERPDNKLLPIVESELSNKSENGDANFAGNSTSCYFSDEESVDLQNSAIAFLQLYYEPQLSTYHRMDLQNYDTSSMATVNTQSSSDVCAIVMDQVGYVQGLGEAQNQYIFCIANDNNLGNCAPGVTIEEVKSESSMKTVSYDLASRNSSGTLSYVDANSKEIFGNDEVVGKALESNHTTATFTVSNNQLFCGTPSVIPVNTNSALFVSNPLLRLKQDYGNFKYRKCKSSITCVEPDELKRQSPRKVSNVNESDSVDKLSGGSISRFKSHSSINLKSQRYQLSTTRIEKVVVGSGSSSSKTWKQQRSSSGGNMRGSHSEGEISRYSSDDLMSSNSLRHSRSSPIAVAGCAEDDNTILYVHVVNDNSSKLVDPKNILEFMKENRLEIRDIISVDKSDTDIGPSIKILECKETTKPDVVEASVSAGDNQFTDDVFTSPYLQRLRENVPGGVSDAWSSKLQREIEISAKPTMLDNSTSVSDLKQLDIVKIQKKFTNDERRVLIKLVRQNSNLFHNCARIEDCIVND